MNPYVHLLDWSNCIRCGQPMLYLTHENFVWCASCEAWNGVLVSDSLDSWLQPPLSSPNGDLDIYMDMRSTKPTITN